MDDSCRASIEEDVAALRADVDSILRAIVDIHGSSGTNGKLGETRRRVDTVYAWAGRAIAFVAGSVGTLIVKLVIVTRTFGALESSTAETARRLDRIEQFLRSNGHPPEKVTPQ